MYRMKTCLGLGLLLLTTMALADVIKIPDGDVDALRAAIDKANETPDVPVTIELAANGRYVFNVPLQSIHGTLVIEGNYATLDGSGGAASLFYIAGGRTVHISHVHVTGFNVKNRFGGTLVSNSFADVLITDSSFTNNHWVASAGVIARGSRSTVITNCLHCHTVLRNVTISGNSAQVVFPVQGIAVYNGGGTVRIENSTIVNNSINPHGDGGGNAAIVTDIFESGPVSTSTVVSNSIVANNAAVNCKVFIQRTTGPTGSAGHNIDSDGSCGFDGPGDLSNVDPLLSDLSEDAIPVHHLLPGSPALDAGDDARCPVTDAQGRLRPADGDGDGTATCDIGAVEEPAADGNGPGLAQLAEGGFNGFYFDQAHDGHYVTIQRVRENDILVIWNTFDKAGNPAWVFGVGQREGETIRVDAYRQTGGVLQAGGAPQGQAAERWGTLEVDLSSCQGGTFHYDSALPGFGSGEFELDRLGFAFELGCSAGAVDVATTPPPRPLLAGGYNGFYFDRAHDGHYVTIQRVRENDILVIWNTFDKSGDPAWVFGVGHRDGHTITVDAYRQTGGVLQAGGAPQGQSDERWGQLQVDLSSCQGGTFHYDSALPGFGSGEFDLDRLGFSFELGCAE